MLIIACLLAINDNAILNYLVGFAFTVLCFIYKIATVLQPFH